MMFTRAYVGPLPTRHGLQQQVTIVRRFDTREGPWPDRALAYFYGDHAGKVCFGINSASTGAALRAAPGLGVARV
jgi:hypothetical protein